MQLGTLIARELDCETNSDTLSRWMAHHLAELITDAEEIEGDERHDKLVQILELISKVWSHRASFPHKINPLSKLSDLISLVKILDPSTHLIQTEQSDDPRDLLSNTYYRFQLVVVHALLLISGTTSIPQNVKDFEPFLDEQEGELMKIVKRWICSIRTPFDRRVRIEWVDPTTSMSEASSGDMEVDNDSQNQLNLQSHLSEEIDILIEELDSLKSKLSNIVKSKTNG